GQNPPVAASPMRKHLACTGWPTRVCLTQDGISPARQASHRSRAGARHRLGGPPGPARRDQRFLPIWSPMTPPMAAPPTVPSTPPLVMTAPATPPRPAPVTAAFWRPLMLSQDEQPAAETASMTAASDMEAVLSFMEQLLLLCLNLLEPQASQIVPAPAVKFAQKVCQDVFGLAWAGGDAAPPSRTKATSAACSAGGAAWRPLRPGDAACRPRTPGSCRRRTPPASPPRRPGCGWRCGPGTSGRG